MTNNAWANYNPDGPGHGRAAGSGGGGSGPSSYHTGPAHSKAYQQEYSSKGKGRGGPQPQFQYWNWDRDGTRRDMIQFDDGEELVPIYKDKQMSLHPSVSNRSGAENEKIRAMHSIRVSPLEEDSHQYGQYMDAPWTELAECGFPEQYISALRTMRFKEPTPIQMQAWPTGLSGKNIVAVAPTGSGKTMAYVLPMLAHLATQKQPGPGQGPLAVILAPTKELIRQVSTVINGLLHIANMQLICKEVSGDEPFEHHVKMLQGVVEIVVATPGRWLSLLQRGVINQKRTGFFVLDEADDLVDESRGAGFGDKEGFLPQLQSIFQVSRPDRQVWLFSATWQTENINNLKYICGAGQTVRIEVGGTKLMACKDVTQKFWCQSFKLWQPEVSKLEMLVQACQKLQCTGQAKAMIFCQSRNMNEVTLTLKQKGMNAEAYVDGILDKFRVEGEPPYILVCTDALQRGVDLPLVRFVINYDMPRNLTAYVHRVGRTGRYGNKGHALTLMEDADFRQARGLADMMEALGQTSEALQEAARRDKIAWRTNQRQTQQQQQQQQLPLTSLRRPTSRRAEFLRECRELAMQY